MSVEEKVSMDTQDDPSLDALSNKQDTSVGQDLILMDPEIQTESPSACANGSTAESEQDSPAAHSELETDIADEEGCTAEEHITPEEDSKPEEDNAGKAEEHNTPEDDSKPEEDNVEAEEAGKAEESSKIVEESKAKDESKADEPRADDGVGTLDDDFHMLPDDEFAAREMVRRMQAQGKQILHQSMLDFRDGCADTESATFEEFLEEKWPDDYEIHCQAMNGNDGFTRSYQAWEEKFNVVVKGMDPVTAARCADEVHNGSRAPTPTPIGAEGAEAGGTSKDGSPTAKDAKKLKDESIEAAAAAIMKQVTRESGADKAASAASNRVNQLEKRFFERYVADFSSHRPHAHTILSSTTHSHQPLIHHTHTPSSHRPQAHNIL
jgi:hypothetical protein